MQHLLSLLLHSGGVARINLCMGACCTILLARRNLIVQLYHIRFANAAELERVLFHKQCALLGRYEKVQLALSWGWRVCLLNATAEPVVLWPEAAPPAPSPVAMP